MRRRLERAIGERSRSAGSALAAACVLALLASAAQADLLRCMGPDGKWIYTDDKSRCPEAKPFEPQGAIQSSSGSDSPPAARSGRSGRSGSSVDSGSSVKDRLRRAEARRRAAEAEEAQAQRWRDKKTQLEQAVAKIEERRTYLEKFITLCNRGGTVFARDDSGIKRTVKCSTIKSQYASLAGQADEAHADLDRLPDECRKAGCLPGWLR